MTRPLRGRAAYPRACLRCFEVKEPTEFDMGPAGVRRLGRCRDCVARDAAESEQRAAERRATWLDPESGRMVRRCGRCREVQPLDEQHFAWANREHTEFQWWCRPCATEARASSHRARMAEDPEYAARWREQQARLKRAWNEANRERSREIQRRNRARVKRDPQRLRSRRERDRMRYRMRAERQGQDVTTMRRAAGTSRTVEREKGGHLPSAPLAKVIEARIARASGATMEEVCGNLGIHARMFTAWRSGERTSVQADVADRVIQNLGLLWFDLVDEEEDPDAYARYEAAFG